MSSLRQVVLQPRPPEADPGSPPMPLPPSGQERRSRQRNNVYPFESRDTRLRFAAQAAGFGTYDLDCDTGDSVWSPELRAIAGLEPSSSPLTTEQAEALIHPDDREAFLERLQASLHPQGSGELVFEYRILRPDGETRWVRTKGRTFFVGEESARRPLAATGVVMDISAQRAAERGLKENREELDDLIESSLDAVITIDDDHRITRFNPAAARMFGCSEEEAMGERVERFMPERYRASHPEKVSEFAKGNFPARALEAPRSFRGLRANGEEFPFESTITKTRVQGRLRMTAFIKDITDRVRLEEELRHSKEDLELAIRAANIGVWHWDMKTEHAIWSERQHALFGIPVGETLNTGRIMEAIHPEDREHSVEAARQALESGQPYHAEIRVLWPDGSVRWLESLGRYIFDDESSYPNALRGITFDITERRLQEEALRRSKDDLQLAIQGADIGVWHWDSRSGALEFSPRCRQLFGIPGDGSMPLVDFLASMQPEDGERVTQAVQRAMERGEEYRMERQVTWADGSVHWIQCIGRNLQDENGRAVGLRGVSLDVTDRRHYEQDLKGSNSVLETQVRQRTQQLTDANEALTRSNQELQQFAYIAAHDLQTPLRSISGFAQLLKMECDGQLNEQAGLWLAQLIHSVQRMHDLIQDLLAYSRVDSRGGAFRPTDFNRVFDEVLQSLDAFIREEGGTVTRDELPTVLGDPIQLGQMLQNLIDNGLKYHGQEAPRVHVSARLTGGEWVFSVRDNGIGVPAKHVESIFEIFKRLHTQKQYPGTGIGLAVCRRVIHRHGGRIWLESEPGHGSVFRFTLPAIVQPSGDAPTGPPHDRLA